jgi:hypothetical protein
MESWGGVVFPCILHATEKPKKSPHTPEEYADPKPPLEFGQLLRGHAGLSDLAPQPDDQRL